ncbi:MAG: TonB family protein [bacterium]|nr:TonB family protein [bacterium]
MSSFEDADRRREDRPRLGILAEVDDDLVYRDELTGLFNHRLLTLLLDQWLSEVMSHCDQVAVIMIDLDGFKAVNDTYGHLTGDDVLLETATILTKHFRSNDVVVRYGGDEFAVVLPGVSAGEAAVLAERARSAMGEHRFHSREGDQPIEVTVSFSLGMASSSTDGVEGRKLLEQADRRLLEEKARRRQSSANWRIAEKGPFRPVLWLVLIPALVAAMYSLFLFLQEWWAPTDQGRDRVEVVSANWTAQEARLMAEIEALRGRVEVLSDIGTPPPQADDDAEHEITQLRESIRRLEAELSERMQRPDERADEPSSITTSGSDRLGTNIEESVGLTVPVDTDPTPAVSLMPRLKLADLDPVLIEKRPVLLRYEKPDYPELALRLRREGTVYVRVLVSHDGTVVRADPVGPPAGYGFEDAAREAALGTVFSPGAINGVPAEMETSLTIRFILN